GERRRHQPGRQVGELVRLEALLARFRRAPADDPHVGEIAVVDPRPPRAARPASRVDSPAHQPERQLADPDRGDQGDDAADGDIPPSTARSRLLLTRAVARCQARRRLLAHTVPSPVDGTTLGEPAAVWDAWTRAHLPVPRCGLMTILLTGDSITDAGRDRDDLTSWGNGYAALIGQALADQTVINTGISGNRVVDLQGRWDTDVLAHTPAVLS